MSDARDHARGPAVPRAEPVSAAELAEAIEVEEEPVAEALEALEASSPAPAGEGGLRKVAGGYALAAVPTPRTQPGGCWRSRGRRR